MRRCVSFFGSWALLFCALAGCQTVVELDLPEPESLLVINSVLNPDSVVRVDVSSSQSVYTSGAYPPVENATVQLYQNGQLFCDVPHVGGGVYKATRKPQARQTYELRVSAPAYPSASATTTVLSAPVIDAVRARAAPSRSGSGQRTLDVFFTLTDAAEDNYYYLRAYTPAISPDDTKRTYRKAVSLTFIAPIEDEFSMEGRYFFNDKLFNGQLLALQLNLDTNPRTPVYIQVAHVPKSYYEYVKLLEKQSYRDNVFAIPTPVANNIINGLGLFTSANDTLL